MAFVDSKSLTCPLARTTSPRRRIRLRGEKAAVIRRASRVLSEKLCEGARPVQGTNNGFVALVIWCTSVQALTKLELWICSGCRVTTSYRSVCAQPVLLAIYFDQWLTWDGSFRTRSTGQAEFQNLEEYCSIVRVLSLFIYCSDMYRQHKPRLDLGIIAASQKLCRVSYFVNCNKHW